MGNFITLETERMILRDHRLSDLDSHHELFAQRWDIRKEYFLRMEEKKNANHIGEIGYTVTNFTPFGKLVHMGSFKETECHDGKMKDRVLYRMLKKEYETIYLKGGSV